MIAGVRSIALLLVILTWSPWIRLMVGIPAIGFLLITFAVCGLLTFTRLPILIGVLLMMAIGALGSVAVLLCAVVLFYRYPANRKRKRHL